MSRATRWYRRWSAPFAALITLPVLSLAGPGSAAPAALLTALPARAHSAWAANSWASGTGNTMADVGKAISLNLATSQGLDGRGVGIALIDTGVVPVPGLPASHVVNGPDLSFESQATQLRYLDSYGHGTHLAGIIVGNDSTTGFRGIAPGAKLTSIKVGTANGTVDVTQVMAAINWVVQHRNDDPAYPIRVINLAYGTDAVSNRFTDPLQFAVDDAWAHGITVVVAAGNDGGTDHTHLDNPALSHHLLTVGSLNTNGTAYQDDDTPSAFSSTESDRRVDILAPGEGIVSLRNPGSYLDNTYPGARVGTNLFRGSGSSQATAVVSGVVALLLQKRPTATPDDIRAVLWWGATPLAGDTTSTGALDLEGALMGIGENGNGGTYRSSGLGLLDNARGSVRIVHNGKALQGSTGLFGPFDNQAWVNAVDAGTAWQGGKWMGHRMAGDGWTGTSWASKTWAGATWTNTDWSQQTWGDSDWSSHYWSGHYWSGHYWSADDWQGHYWSASAWRDLDWAGAGWTSAYWG
jgi:serine protease AprX